MRIGFDISQTGQSKSGCGYYTHMIISHLAKINQNNQYLLYSNFGPYVWDENHLKLSQNVPTTSFYNGFTNFINHSDAIDFWRGENVNLKQKLGDPDIIHSNNYYCPLNISNIKLVYTLYDLAIFEYPELFGKDHWMVGFDGLFNASIRADMIIAISEYTKHHFLEIFPHYKSEKIKVCYPASRFTKMNIGIKRNIKEIEPFRFWLSVGTIEPRKNLRRLLTAYASMIKNNRTKFPLVMVGGTGWLEEGLTNFINSLGIINYVKVMGYVEDGDLEWLYENCFSFIYPSLFEGFGMPVLEAMSLGAAVITSNKSSLPEVGGESVLYVNPESTDDIYLAMDKLVRDKEIIKNLKERSIERSKNFSWDKTARQIQEIYRTLYLE